MKNSTVKSFSKLLSVLRGAAILSTVALYTTGCQKDECDDTGKWETAQYLDISPEAAISDMDEWSAADINAYRKASLRMTIERGKNGFLSIKEKSARELNISPALYAACIEIIDNTNRFIEKKAEEMLKNGMTPLLKTRGENNTNINRTDCVAVTFSYVLLHFGTNTASNEINNALEETYGEGKGVPASQFISEAGNYFSGGAVSLSDISSSYRLGSKSSHVYLVAMNITNMGGHAAVLDQILGDWIEVKDIQNGGKIKVHKTEIISIFDATGVAAQ